MIYPSYFHPSVPPLFGYSREKRTQIRQVVPDHADLAFIRGIAFTKILVSQRTFRPLMASPVKVAKPKFLILWCLQEAF